MLRMQLSDEQVDIITNRGIDWYMVDVGPDFIVVEVYEDEDVSFLWEDRRSIQ